MQQDAGAKESVDSKSGSSFLPSHLRDSRPDSDSGSSGGSASPRGRGKARGKHKRKEKREHRKVSLSQTSRDGSDPSDDESGRPRGLRNPPRTPQNSRAQRGIKGGHRRGAADLMGAFRDLQAQAAAAADIVKENTDEKREKQEADEAAKEAAVAEALQLRREEIQEALTDVEVVWYDRPRVTMWDFVYMGIKHVMTWSLLFSIAGYLAGIPSLDWAGAIFVAKAFFWYVTRAVMCSLVGAALFDLVEIHRGNSASWWTVSHEYTFSGAMGWVDAVPTSDTRTDQSSVGEGRHKDPILCWFRHRRSVYIGGFHFMRRDTRMLVSGELLMQLLDGSNMRLSSTMETACARMEDVASRSQTVILDRKIALGGGDTQVKVNTAAVAYGFWEAMREKMKHVPFHRSPSRQ